MKPSSEKRLQSLHPALVSAVRAVVEDLAGERIVLEVVQGLRTFEEQDALFAQGRTKPGPVVTQARGGESNHNYGLAADLCPFVDGKPDWNAPIGVWARLGATAAKHGLDWGGAWQKFIDKPHVELRSLTVRECRLLFQDGGLPAVWEAASGRLAAGAPRALPGPARARKKPARKRKKAVRRKKPARPAKKTAPRKKATRKSQSAKRQKKSIRRRAARSRGVRKSTRDQ